MPELAGYLKIYAEFEDHPKAQTPWQKWVIFHQSMMDVDHSLGCAVTRRLTGDLVGHNPLPAGEVFSHVRRH